MRRAVRAIACFLVFSALAGTTPDVWRQDAGRVFAGTTGEGAVRSDAASSRALVAEASVVARFALKSRSSRDHRPALCAAVGSCSALATPPVTRIPDWFSRRTLEPAVFDALRGRAPPPPSSLIS
jgi:hypothetical protein